MIKIKTTVTDKQLKHYNNCEKIIAECKICVKLYDKMMYNRETKQFEILEKYIDRKIKELDNK